jgi:2-(1,2-epoxy-1,2-dihydrophenyl)acetyl-CoA isomerase
MTQESVVNVEVEDGVAVIHLNDPPSRNALSEDAAVKLNQVLETIHESARAVIITGAGKGFCSGAKLGTGGKKIPREERDLSASLKTFYNPLFRTIKSLDIPFISAINGPAAGIGSALALSADFIFMSKEAFILPAFSRIGLIPDGGLSYLLAKSVGRVRAMEIVLLDEKISPEQALEWGMVNRLADADELMAHARELGVRLATGPTKAYSSVRQLMWTACECSFEEQLEAEAAAQFTLGRTEDHEEGVRAFMTREKPNFKGK